MFAKRKKNACLEVNCAVMAEHTLVVFWDFQKIGQQIRQRGIQEHKSRHISKRGIEIKGQIGVCESLNK
jgi:hypothetical protein